MGKQMTDKEAKERADAVGEPSQGALLAALEQNWLHARHQESQRFWLLNVYLLITLGIVSLISAKGFFTITAVISLVFLFILSLSVFLVLIKLNAEFSNHIRAVQWIAEKLKLIKAIESGKSVDKKIMFKGFMALPLPLPIRAHEIFFTYLPLFITATAFALFFSSILGISKILGEGTIPITIISIIVFIIIVLVLYYGILKKVKKESRDILEGREPEGLKIKYP